jgi:peptide/nickel transport system substrate-binding protein
MTDVPRAARGLLAAALAVAVAGLGGCAQEGGGAAVLTVGATAEPDTFDFTQSANAGIPEVLLYNVYETLYKVNQEGALEPLLAGSYEVSDDRLTYTFALADATFASGTPVTAEAVIASFQAHQSAANTIVSAPLAKIAAFATPDDKTVAITLKAPSNTWLYDMTSTAGIVVDPAATDLATTPAGSGPYTLESWTPGDRITLARNDAYWGDLAAYGQVEFRYFSDASAMTFALQTGDLDLTTNLTSPTSISQFEDNPDYQVLSGLTQGEVVLGFNHQRQALQDVRVRQAINYAIDRQALVDTAWGGYGALIGSMVIPTDAYYEDLSQTYPYDPAKAKALLAEAGVTNLKLALRVPADLPYAPPAAQFIASALGEVGITVTVEELDFTGGWLPQVFTNGDYDLTIVAHTEPRDIGSFADPSYYWHYDNAEFQALIAEADQAAPDEFAPLMQEAARLLAEDAAADWLFVLPQLIVARAGLEGVPLNQTSLAFDVTTIKG